jgi:hypothetical protein
LDNEKTKLEAQFQERVDVAKKELSDAEIQVLLKSNPTAIAILEADLANKVKEAKKQLSETEIREILRSNPTASAVFRINLNKELTDEKAKITATLKAEFEEKVRSAKEVAGTERANSDVLGVSQVLNMTKYQLKEANAKLSVVEMAAKERPCISVTAIWGEVEGMHSGIPATASIAAFPSPSSSQIGFGAGISRLTTPFGYPVGVLGSVTKTTSPSKPRGPLELLSNPFANPKVQSQLFQKAEVQSNNNIRFASETSPLFKRLRETDDVGGSDAGSKKVCKEENKK